MFDEVFDRIPVYVIHKNARSLRDQFHILPFAVFHGKGDFLRIAAVCDGGNGDDVARSQLRSLLLREPAHRNF